METAEISKIIPINQFLQINVNRQQGGLLESVLKKHYKDLYDRRNSLAHNLNSFKPRFPLFRELVNEGDLDNNYFGMSANFNYQKGLENLEGILYGTN